MTTYVNFRDISKLQKSIMKYVSWWVKNEKTPIPQKEIIKKMEQKKIKNYTVVNALNSLLKMGYLRRAQIISNRTYYVQLRGI